MTMPTVQEAEAALAAARQRHEDAYQGLEAARARAREIEAEIRGGRATDPGQLAAAKAAVDHGELVYAGTEPALREAEAALRLARANDTCDLIASTVRSLGSDVVRSLEALDGPLRDFVGAAKRYDLAVQDATNHLGSVASESPRWRSGPYCRTTVDDIFVEKCRPMSLLARLLLPHVKEIAPSYVREQFGQLAEGAPALPTEDQ